ncbi:hypothetical protein [Streptomyces sp. NPDC048521]|uniref:hypothetical protein n=1 Tax=Streptomyces sp. NPDC048521 TaxID=3365566 RepID=UPI00371CDD9F
MTTRSSSPRPDDSLIPPAPAASHLTMRPAPLLEQLPGAGHQDALPYGDPLHELVRAAVADRPVEDVVRLITLLERSPEHARTTADALRAAAVDRSVEDVTRLVTLLTKPPRESDSADEAIRAAAERRSLEDVIRLMQLLHRTPVEPRCGQAAVQAAAVGRPVEELAELISRLAAERAVPPSPPREQAPHEPAGSLSAFPGSMPTPAGFMSASAAPTAAAAAATRAATVPGLTEQPMGDRPTKNLPTKDRSAQGRSAKGLEPKGREAKGRSERGREAEGREAKDHRAGRSPAACLWVARGAALLVFLCGVAHVPRYWSGLDQGVLGATVVVAGLCMLLALVLPAPAAPARLVAATAAVGVTVVLAVGQVLDGRFTPPGLSQLWDAALAPPWLAGTAAAAAALATLVALVVTLAAGNSHRDGGR